MRFNQDEVIQIIKAVTYYRDKVVGCEFLWDEYDQLIEKLNYYREEVSDFNLSFPPDK